MTEPSKGSIRELKNRLVPKAYKKVKAHIAKNFWYIIAWDNTKLVLHIEGTNYRFKLDGTLMEKHTP